MTENEEPRTVVLQVPVEPSLHKKLRVLAAIAGMPAQDYYHLILSRWVASRQLKGIGEHERKATE